MLLSIKKIMKILKKKHSFLECGPEQYGFELGMFLKCGVQTLHENHSC